VNAGATWAALGTTAAVVVTDPAALAAARAAVEAELRAIDVACSRFHADSEISRLNRAAGRPTRVGSLLAEAVLCALRAAWLTGGAVDPTVGGAVIAAGYDRDFAALRPRPRPAAVRVPGWRVVRVEPDGETVRMPAGVTLDLGATAKALAADRAARAAAAATGCGVLVNLGGDLATAGPAPVAGWRVRVTDDHTAPEGAGETVEITAGGLATSSTTVRRWATGHHIVDPATGAPAAAPWRTVSVAAASCVDANVASTAAIVLGDAAPAWLAQRGLPARLCAQDGAVVRLAGWPQECAT
jgi:thiamine biosynthesis lipoprotein